MRRRRSPLRWILGAVVVVAALVFGGAYAYIHLVEGDPPARLSATSALVPEGAASPGAPAAPPVGDVAGRWDVTAGSQAGYRVEEILAGQSTTAVGRTDAVTGSLTATATQVTAGSFTVDLTRVSSDQSRRDAQFRGPIMDTAQFPTAVFTLSAPLDLGALATAGGTATVPVEGTLAMHGVTRQVDVPLTVVRTGTTVAISGQIPVTFGDYGIDNPSIGSFVKTGDTGIVEVLLTLTRA